MDGKERGRAGLAGAGLRKDRYWLSAVRTYEVMVAAYTAAGYELVPLPLASVEERLAFVLDRV